MVEEKDGGGADGLAGGGDGADGALAGVRGDGAGTCAPPIG